MSTPILAQGATAVKETNEHAVEQIVLHVNLAIEWHDQIDKLTHEADARWYDLGANLLRARNVARCLKRMLVPLGTSNAPDTEREVLNAAVIAAARQTFTVADGGPSSRARTALRKALAALDQHDRAAADEELHHCLDCGKRMDVITERCDECARVAEEIRFADRLMGDCYDG